jgi:outer membrane lipoprotein-sorting protein
MKRVRRWMAAATVAAISVGCAATHVSTKRNVPVTARPVALEASREELLEKYNVIARGVKSISATIELKSTAGSEYSGVIEEYHEVKAFLLAERPEKIRMIGQAPVIGRTIFDMTSDGQTFQVSIPSKNKFLVGQVAAERTSNKPIENLRPQHLLDALLWPEVQKEESVLAEEFNDEKGRYYVLTVLRGGYQTEILRKIWFDRADLHVSRTQSYGPRGVLVSDSHFANWQPLIGDEEQVAVTPGGVTSFPREIWVERPHDDYRLELTITKLALNGGIPADRFELLQPAGSELVNVGETRDEKKPPKDSKP